MFSSHASGVLSWSEPWLFKLRTSSRTGWIVRGLFFTGVYVLFAVLLHMEQGSPNGPKCGTAGKLLRPALIGVVCLSMFEVPNAQRIVSVTDNGVSCIGAFMYMGGPIHLITGMRHWNLRELKHIELLRPGAPGNDFPFGLMVVTPKYSSAKQIGVPAEISLDAIADRLHAMGADTRLSDWRPDDAKSTVDPAAN